MSITLNGSIPPSATPVVIMQANPGIGRGRLLKFKFSAPALEAGEYALNFCVGPESNPCGSSTSFVVNVPANEERLALIEASVFKKNVLVVGQGTEVSAQFSVTIE